MKPQPRRSAAVLAVDLLSHRDHSESELRRKLEERGYPLEEIELALVKVKNAKLISSPEDLANRLAEQLDIKNKGIEFINATLAEKGLPTISRNEEHELEKIQKILKTKFPAYPELSGEDKTKATVKVLRFLTSRGFDSSTIRKAIDYDEEF